jgi:DNA-binding MarR family transcriptional regulator
MRKSCDLSELDKIAYELHKKLFAQITEGIEFPVTSSHIYMLNYLKNQHECMVTDIANYLGVTLGAVTSLVDRLYDFGLVSRERSEIDRRLVMIRLSERGEELLKKIAKRRQEIFNYYLKDMDEEELLYLSKIAEKMIAKILHS